MTSLQNNVFMAAADLPFFTVAVCFALRRWSLMMQTIVEE